MKTTYLQIMEHNYPMALARCPNYEDGAFDGSCPCGHIDGDGFTIDFHCWRSGCDYGCVFSGIHVKGSISKVKMIRMAIHIRNNNGWKDRTDWNITVESE